MAQIPVLSALCSSVLNLFVPVSASSASSPPCLHVLPFPTRAHARALGLSALRPLRLLGVLSVLAFSRGLLARASGSVWGGLRRSGVGGHPLGMGVHLSPVGGHLFLLAGHVFPEHGHLLLMGLHLFLMRHHLFLMGLHLLSMSHHLL